MAHLCLQSLRVYFEVMQYQASFLYFWIISDNFVKKCIFFKNISRIILCRICSHFFHTTEIFHHDLSFKSCISPSLLTGKYRNLVIIRFSNCHNASSSLWVTHIWAPSIFLAERFLILSLKSQLLVFMPYHICLLQKHRRYTTGENAK